MTDEEVKAAIVLPKWFLWVMSILCSGFVIMFVPWATWVTVALITITAQNSVDTRNELKLDNVIVKVNDHLADPEIHHALLKGPIRDIERRLIQLEMRVEQAEHRVGK